MSRERKFCFTLNNYTPDEEEKIKSMTKMKPEILFMIYGKEVGANGTPHLQGYIYYKNPQYLDSLKNKIKRWHLEPQWADNDSVAINYCKKENVAFTFGEPPRQGKRNDIELVYEKVKAGTNVDEIVMEFPSVYNQCHRTLHKMEDILMRKKYRNSMTQGEWLFGPTGVGKSKYAFSDLENTYIYPYDNGWWDAYRQEKIVVIDEFRGQLTFSELLRMVDMNPNYSVRRRCREPLPFNSEKVIITSSLPPWKVYSRLDEGDNINQLFRRFKVYQLTAEGKQEITFDMYDKMLD